MEIQLFVYEQKGNIDPSSKRPGRLINILTFLGGV